MSNSEKPIIIKPVPTLLSPVDNGTYLNLKGLRKTLEGFYSGKKKQPKQQRGNAQKSRSGLKMTKSSLRIYLYSKVRGLSDSSTLKHRGMAEVKMGQQVQSWTVPGQWDTWAFWFLVWCFTDSEQQSIANVSPKLAIPIIFQVSGTTMVWEYSG